MSAHLTIAGAAVTHETESDASTEVIVCSDRSFPQRQTAAQLDR
jgi:hypothetical protein